MTSSGITFMWSLTLLAAVAIAGRPAGAEEIHVPADYAFIQFAIDAAADGDEIIVAPGTYSGFVLNDKTVHVQSSAGPDQTTLTDSGRVIDILSTPGAGSVIEGFTITNNDSGKSAVRITQSDPTFRNCHFVSNSAVGWDDDASGGAVDMRHSNATIEDCTFTENVASEDGGAIFIYAGQPSIVDCAFDRNMTEGHSSNGGGDAIYGNVEFIQIHNCTFVDNGPDQSAWSWPIGGAVRLNGGGLIEACDFIGNSHQVGAALIVGYNMTVRHCHFEDNISESGGAVATTNGIQGLPPATFQSCTFLSNTALASGGALYAGDDVNIVNCTFESNTALNHGAVSIGALAEDIEITYSTFIGNESKQSGGAFGVDNSNPDTNVSVLDTTFLANVAASGRGGAAVFDEDWQGHSAFIECTFENNQAAEAGGAIAVDRQAAPPEIGDGFFCENTPDPISGPWIDLGGNVFADVCPTDVPGDLTGDGAVGGDDLGVLLSQWGACDTPAYCPADLTSDGFVDGADLGILLSNWTD